MLTSFRHGCNSTSPTSKRTLKKPTQIRVEYAHVFCKVLDKVRNLIWSSISSHSLEKQPSIGVLIKRCSENMKQIYRRTPIPKCDFSKVSKQLSWNHTSALVFTYKFRTSFRKNTSGELLLSFSRILKKSIHWCWIQIYSIVFLFIQRRIQNPLAHLRWSFLRK